MKARDLLSVEELLNLNFLPLCKETMAAFKRRTSGRNICFSTNGAMLRVPQNPKTPDI